MKVSKFNQYITEQVPDRDDKNVAVAVITQKYNLRRAKNRKELTTDFIVSACKKLKNPNIFINNLAITNEVGEKKFFINDEDQKSSFYNLADYKGKVKEIISKTTSIDEYCKLKNTLIL